jgi:competence protein ComEC
MNRVKHPHLVPQSCRRMSPTEGGSESEGRNPRRNSVRGSCWIKSAPVLIPRVSSDFGEPDVRDTYTNLRLAVDRVQIEDKEHRVKGKVLVRAKRYLVYAYGDELEVEGQLETPPVFDGFSYRDYLARRGIHGMIGWPKITLLSRGRGSPVYHALLLVKARIYTTIARILPEPEASLLAGILLGVESGISERVKDAFSTSGTMHVVAVSGFN